MKTKYYFLAAIAGLTLASCSSDDFVGDLSPTTSQVTSETDAIKFGFDLSNMTRGDIAGAAAADLLSNRFYVTGTKGEEKATHPTDSLVFDNYLVTYTANTAGTTASNTANWEYVGLAPSSATSPTPEGYSGTCNDSLKLSADNVKTQAIKYWDYAHLQYDFLAFSTGIFKAVDGIDPSDNTKTVAPSTLGVNEIGVTPMKYGDDLVGSAVAYTFVLPSVKALKNAYITDITEVARANFGKEVTLKFKNLGSKVRIALYETVPGYSILASSVKFYTVDGTTDFNESKGTDAALISTDAKGFASAGTLKVFFPNIGTNNHSNTNYDKAATTVDASAGASSKTFGALENLADEEGTETDGTLYLGRTLPTATFAGSATADYYETVFPVSTGSPLTLRVDYQLVATDGSGETIDVYGAKAVVPATYTVWQPNYAYTYIFKITDNTNGWTSTDAKQEGLFPITFDAVVAEATDASGKQTTITTVATPTITTYQQNHNTANEKKPTTDEYSTAIGKNIYVQVMDNKNTTSPTLKDDLSGDTPEGKAKSLLYKLDNDHANATEAIVMDALEKRTATYSGDAAIITGRNGLVLTKSTITNKVNEIVNGVDDNPIDVSIEGEKKSKAAMITITGTGALDAGTYAYVYDYTATARTEIEEYQPIVPGETHVESATSTKTYYTVTTAQLTPITAETAAVDLTAADANNYLYFSKTTNGTGTPTYSYISIVGKTSLPAGVVKIAKTSVGTTTGSTTPVPANTFIFDKYFSNNGSYAVKVIKVVTPVEP